VKKTTATLAAISVLLWSVTASATDPGLFSPDLGTCKVVATNDSGSVVRVQCSGQTLWTITKKQATEYRDLIQRVPRLERRSLLLDEALSELETTNADRRAELEDRTDDEALIVDADLRAIEALRTAESKWSFWEVAGAVITTAIVSLGVGFVGGVVFQ
jgi:hypothetical protein